MSKSESFGLVWNNYSVANEMRKLSTTECKHLTGKLNMIQLKQQQIRIWRTTNLIWRFFYWHKKFLFKSCSGWIRTKTKSKINWELKYRIYAINSRFSKFWKCWIRYLYLCFIWSFTLQRGISIKRSFWTFSTIFL